MEAELKERYAAAEGFTPRMGELRQQSVELAKQLTFRTSERDALASQLAAAQQALELEQAQQAVRYNSGEKGEGETADGASSQREKLLRKMAQELREVKMAAAEREKKLKHHLQRVKAEREEALLQVERAQRDKLKSRSAANVSHPLQATRE